jgi:hypothetical protein
LLWQVANAKALPQPFDATGLLEELRKEGDPVLKLLFESVLASAPRERITAAELAQRFQDRYNELRAAQLEGQSALTLF